MKDDREVREAVARIAGINPKNVICTEDRGVLFINLQTSMTMLEKHEAMKNAAVAIVGLLKASRIRRFLPLTS